MVGDAHRVIALNRLLYLSECGYSDTELNKLYNDLPRSYSKIKRLCDREKGKRK